MNRAQRSAHARLWPILILVLLAVSAAALVARARVDNAVLEAGATLSQDE